MPSPFAQRVPRDEEEEKPRPRTGRGAPPKRDPARNGTHDKYEDIAARYEDWLFLCAESSGHLARCCEPGLDVDNWNRNGIEKTLKDKKIILVCKSVDPDVTDEFKAHKMAHAAGAATIRIWKPSEYGSEKYPTLEAYAKQFALAEVLHWDDPQSSDSAGTPEEARGGHPLTDLGNAERMAHQHRTLIRYCRPWKSWLVWNGQKWAKDELGKVESMAKQTVRTIRKETRLAYDDQERKHIMKWAQESESAARIKAMLNLVWCEPRIPVLPAIFDADPWAFNCPNGTINLKTGELRQHNRADLITRMSPVEFDPKAACPLWEQAIETIFAKDDDLIRFVQRLFGLCLTGDTSEQILPIFYGEGANGKSTILNTMLDLMGPDYAIAAPPGLLFNRSNNGHPTDKASLFGMRLVVDLESAEGATINEATVKQLTGSDRISARRMREDFWTFLPTHKIILATNNQPTIRETQNAIWRRLRLVPFNVNIPEAEQDPQLPAKLKLEAPGILAWAVRGCVDWVGGKLRTPPVVLAATAEYRAEEDTLGRWIEEACETGASQYRIKSTQLYAAYREAMEAAGQKCFSQTSFGRSMRKLGYEKTNDGGMTYHGITLRQEDPKPEDRIRKAY